MIVCPKDGMVVKEVVTLDGAIYRACTVCDWEMTWPAPDKEIEK